jgi:hypothetical protein
MERSAIIVDLRRARQNWNALRNIKQGRSRALRYPAPRKRKEKRSSGQTTLKHLIDTLTSNCRPLLSIRGLFFLSKNSFEYLPGTATLTFMRNYRRLSGDGSVKVVLSGDSNSLPKTTGRREPPSYNSPPPQELRTSPAIPFAFLRVPSRFQENVDFPSESLRKFQKMPVFAPPPFAQRTSTVGNIIVAGLGSLIRGLCDSQPAPEFSIITFLFPAATDHRQRTTYKPKNVDSAPPPFARLQNPLKKARESAIIHVSTFAPFAPKPSNFRTLNLRAAPRTSHLLSPKTPAIPAFSALSPNPTPTSQQKVDCFPLDLALGNSLVIRFWTSVIPRCAGLSLQKNNFSSCPLCVLGGFVVKGSFHPKFQKKPVFAPPPCAKRTSKPGCHYRGGLGKPIRGLFPTLFGQNVDSCRFPKLSNFQILNLGTVRRITHQNPSKKARNVAYCRITEEISETVFAALPPFHQNVDCALPTPSPFAPLPPVGNPQAPGLRRAVPPKN